MATSIFELDRMINEDVYKKPIPKALIKQDPKKNKYISAYDMIKLADDAFCGSWSFRVERTWSEQLMDFDVVYFAQVVVSVPGLGERTGIGGVSLRDTLFKKEAKGKRLSEVEPNELQATRASDIYKSAVSDGVKKALSCFLIAPEVYSAEKDKMEQNQDERGSYGGQVATPKVKLNLSEDGKATLRKAMQILHWSKEDLSKAMIKTEMFELTDTNLEKFLNLHNDQPQDMNQVLEVVVVEPENA